MAELQRLGDDHIQASSSQDLLGLHQELQSRDAEIAELRGQLNGLLGADQESQRLRTELLTVTAYYEDRLRKVEEQISSNDLKARIIHGETARLEFKSSLRWNVRANRNDEGVEQAVMKTVAAFCNTEGELLIGVSSATSLRRKRRPAMRILLALTVLALAVSSLSATQADEESAIREIQARWDDAWNRNDVKGLSSLVAEDVRLVNVAGQVLTGRREFEQLQTRTHAMQFKESVRTVTGTDIKFLTPDIAVAHVRWGMRGDKDRDGTPRQPRNGVMMQVLMKRDGRWAVVAAQNTDVR